MQTTCCGSWGPGSGGAGDSGCPRALELPPGESLGTCRVCRLALVGASPSGSVLCGVSPPGSRPRARPSFASPLVTNSCEFLGLRLGWLRVWGLPSGDPTESIVQ